MLDAKRTRMARHTTRRGHEDAVADKPAAPHQSVEHGTTQDIGEKSAALQTPPRQTGRWSLSERLAERDRLQAECISTPGPDCSAALESLTSSTSTCSSFDSSSILPNGENWKQKAEMLALLFIGSLLVVVVCLLVGLLRALEGFPYADALRMSQILDP